MSARPDLLTERITVGLPGGGALTAHRARLAGPLEGRPAVIVTHELFGVTTHVREVCERLAELGVVAVAPDLYHRTEAGAELPHDAAGRDHGFELLHQLRRDEALEDLRAVDQRLRADGAPQVGILGLSLGGHAAYLAATALELSPVIVAYPGWLTGTEIGLSRPEPTIARTAGIRGRVLVLTGDADHAVPAEDRSSLAAALAAAGVEHEIVVYPGTPHGFLCDRRDTYEPGAATDAWARIGALVGLMPGVAA